MLSVTNASSTGSTPDCGAGWLSSLQQITTATPGQTTGGIQILSWNDYEGGAQMESGIDNCVSITPAASGSTLSWQVTGNTATIDHYVVFTSTDGTNLTPVATLPQTATSFNLATANLSPAYYTIFIQAVGKPSILNKLSTPVLYAAKQPPTVSVSVSPTSGTAPLAVNASATSSAATGSTISSNSISFGDGTVVNSATAAHTYSTAGSYTVTATATDNNGLTATANTGVTVTASNRSPTAKLTVTPTSGTAPLAVSASTAGSTDPNTGGSITGTTINFGDGSATVSAASANHTYSTPGSYTVTTTVTDNFGLSSTATTTVTVTAPNQPPVAKLSVTPTSGTSPLAVSASTAGSSDPNTGGSITSTTINFGDGSATVSAASANHTYSTPGSYTVTTTVTDNFGLTGAATAGVTVASGSSSSAQQTTVTLNKPAGGTQSYTLGSHPRVLWDGAPWQGAWSSGSAYWMLDAVSYGGSNYQAVQASTGITPGTNSAYWIACPDCGSGQGTLTTSMHNSASGSGRADPNYPPFKTMKASVDAWLAAHPNYATDTVPDLLVYDYNFQNCSQAAIVGYMTQTASYQSLAHFCMNHLEQFQASWQCDESRGRCGNYADTYYSSSSYENIAMLYEFARQLMTSTEITTAANKLFNDLDVNHNGLNPAGQGCNKTPNLISLQAGTISGSTSSAIITGSGTSFTSGNVGMSLIDSGGAVWGYVTSVQSGTQLTLAANSENSGSGSQFYLVTEGLSYSSTASSCGLIWFFKHEDNFPPMTVGQESQWSADYVGAYGEGVVGTSSSSSVSNSLYQDWHHVLLLAEAFADDDPRALLLLQQAYNFRLTSLIGYELSGWTGLDQGGAQYGTWVYTSYMPTAEWSLQKTIQGIPNSLSGGLMNRFVNYYLYMQDPAYTGPMMAYTGDNNGNAFQGSGWLHRSMAIPLYLTGGTTANYGYYYLKSMTGQWTSSGSNLSFGAYVAFIPWSLTFFDPSNAGTTPAGNLPTQYLFQATDSSLCPSVATNCYSTSTNVHYSYFDSKSDWTSTATQLYAMAPTEFISGIDHGSVTFGSYHIHRNGFELLGGDGNGGGGPANTNTPVANSNTGMENMIEVGSYTNFPRYYTNPVYANILRWAGSNPNGDSQSRYAYALLDLGTASYTGGNPNRVQRHILHFKKSGAQDYIVTYDDVATGTAETIKAYHHYFLNGQPEASVITANLGARTIQNVQASSALVSAFLPVEGANTLALQEDAANGTYPSGQGHTYRVYGCASTDGSTCANATAMEEIIVHLPSATTSATMPTLTQPICSATGGSCTAVQIADGSSPKVAVFARQGGTLTGVSLTSTHSGTAQYTIAGMTPGTYNVTVGGSTVVSGATVNANDNTLYFESAAGLVEISQ